MIAIGLGAAPGFARLAENYATSVGSKEFVASARATGVGRGRLIVRYLLPNMAEPLVLAGLAYFAGRDHRHLGPRLPRPRRAAAVVTTGARC